MVFVHRLSLGIPAQDAFAAITNILAIPQWIPSIRSVRMLSPGPVRPGSRFEQAASVAGMRFCIVGRVTGYEPPFHFGYRYPRGVVAGLWSYRIRPATRGCIVEVTIDFSNPRWLLPVVKPIVTRNIERFGRWASAGGEC